MLMKRLDGGSPGAARILFRVAPTLGILTLMSGATLASARPSIYTGMAPVSQYMIADQAREIALARSAAPPSVSAHARVLVLRAHGYSIAVPGNNGFVCLVTRSWDKGFGQAEFWNPKIRSPECFNPPGARSVLSRYLERTQWVLAGLSTAQMRTRAQAVAAKLPAPPPGSFCYMMSKDGYTDDNAAGPWRPHLMFFQGTTPAGQWGANLPGIPIVADSTSYQGLTYFLVIVPHWSDGTWPAHQ